VVSAVGEIVASRRIALILGAGGVGKTTVSAAIATEAVRNGRRVAILTVDPSRSLASTLGLDEGTNEATVEIGGGLLHASVLDPGTAWDGLVTRELGSAAESLLDNPMYRAVTRHFVQAHDFIAIESLHRLLAQDFDLVVVDTPPSRRAVDFLMAPERLGGFFENRALGWFTGTATSPAARAGTRPFAKLAELVLGSSFVGSLTDFFTNVRPLADPIVQRARTVEALLREDDAAALVVTSTESTAVEQGLELGTELAARDIRWEATVVNRVVRRPDGRVPDAATLETELRAGLSGPLAEVEDAAIGRFAERACTAFQRLSEAAESDIRRIADLRNGPPVAVVSDHGPGASEPSQLAVIGAELVG